MAVKEGVGGVDLEVKKKIGKKKANFLLPYHLYMLRVEEVYLSYVRGILLHQKVWIKTILSQLQYLN